MSWSWWCRSKCCDLPWGKKHIKQRCWWRNPTCGCDKASPSLSFAFHSVCEHYPRCTCVIEWTHIELYDLSPINLRLWWMYHLCGCDEAWPPLSLACFFGCIIPSVFTCWSEHTVNFISCQTKILFNEFKFWLWRKLLVQCNDFTSLFWICILRVPHFWSQYTVPRSPLSCIYSISTHYNSWS